MSTTSVSWLNLLGSWGWARPSDILLTVQITASRNISCVDKGAQRPLWIMSIVASDTMDDTKTYLNCGYQFCSIFVSFYSTKGHDYVHLLWIISVDFSEQLRYGTFLNLWKSNYHVSVCCCVRYILDWAGLRITMTWQWARWRIKSPASRLFTQLFIQAQSKNTSKLPSLAFVRGIHRWLVNSPHKGPVTRKMFPLHDAIMGVIYLKVAIPRSLGFTRNTVYPQRYPRTPFTYMDCI